MTLRINAARFARLLVPVLFACAAAAPLAAQTATFQSATRVIQNSAQLGAATPGAIAVDPGGDVFVLTGASSVVTEYPAHGLGPVAIPLVSGWTAAGNAIAADAQGKIYVGVQNSGSYGVEVISAGVASTLALTVTPVAGAPAALAVASSTLFIADSLGDLYQVPTSGGAVTGLLSVSADVFVGLAADTSGNLYGVTAGATGELYLMTSGGSYAPAAVGTAPFTFSHPQQIAVDGAGSVYVTSTDANADNLGSLQKISTPTATASESSAISNADVFGVAFDPAGNLYWTTQGNASTYNAISETSFSSVNFGAWNVASASNTAAVTFNITASGTFGTPLVLTQGTAALDFADAGSGNCSGPLTSGNTCVVNVKFTPAAPGLRSGAVVLVDGTGTRLATVFLQGTGVGPASTFLPQAPATVSSLTSGATAGGVAFDAAGDIFYGDNAGSSTPGIVDELVHGSGTPGSVGTGSGNNGTIGQIAMDGAGNLYFANPATDQIFRVNASALASTASAYGPTFAAAVNGIAVDGAGNVFVADTTIGQIVEIPAANPGTPIDFPGVSISAYNLALDGLGNLFISTADGANAGVQELNLTTGTVTTAITLSGDVSPSLGIAVDGAGSIYLADSAAGVLKYPTPAGPATTLVAHPAYSVAVDSLGNVVYTDVTAPAAVLVNQLPLATPPSLVFASTALGNTSAPLSIVFANAGNAPLTVSALSISNYFASSGGTTCTSTSTVAQATSCALNLVFSPANGAGGGAGSYSGAAIITSNTLNASTAQSLTLVGTGTQTSTQLLFDPSTPTALLVGANAGTVKVDVADANGILAESDTSSVTIAVTGPNGYSQTSAATAASAGVASVDLSAFSLPAAGTYILTATDGSLTSAVANINVVAASLSVANTNVGSNLASTAVTVLIPSAGTVASIAVLTQGLPNKDFTDATGGTCAAQAYAAGATCTVNVKFAPAAAGLRRGAVVLFDASGNPLATIYLSGVGLGPVAAFPAAAPAQVAAVSGQSGLATDGTNFYTVAFGVLKQFSSAGTLTYSSNNIGAGVYSVAVDGAGNVYTLRNDSASGSLLEFANKNGTLSASSTATIASGLDINDSNYGSNLAVDGAGNLYVSSGSLNHIYKYPVGGGAPVQLDQSGATVNDPSAIALDQAGNIFFANNSNPGLSEIPAGTTAVTRFSYANLSPSAIAFDAAGNFYEVPAFDNAHVLEYASITGGSPTLLHTYSVEGGAFVEGLVVTTSGDMVYADPNDGIIGKLQVSAPPALAFGATNPVTQTSAAQTTTVSNIGNADLNFTGYALTNGLPFALSTGAGICSTSTAVTSGTACTVSATFTPASTTAASDTITLTSNAPGSPQTIALSGTGALVTTTISLPAPSSPIYGTAVTTTATVNTASGGSPAYPVPTGTIIYNVDGGASSSAETLTSGEYTINAGVLSAGQHTINVTSYSGDSVYNAISTTTSVTFTVAQVVLTPSLTSTYSKTYDTSATATLTASNFSLATLVNGDTYGGDVTLSYSAANFTGKDVGATSITATGLSLTGAAAGNYTLASTSATGSIGTITPYSSLTVTAANQIFAQGGASLPAFTYTITGFLSGDNAGNSTTGAPNLASSATTASTAGTYPITPSAGSLTSTDYNVSYVVGSLYIIQHAQAMTATTVNSTTSATVTFEATTAGTIGSVAVLNNGSTTADFSKTATTCSAGAFNAGSNCTVTVQFKPLAPGLRQGAVVLFDNSLPAVPLQTIYLSGIGNGALAGFTPEYGSFTTALAATTALAFDGTTGGSSNINGAIYFGQTTSVSRVLLGNGQVTNNIVTGLTDVTALALDGADNLYAVDSGAGTVLKFTKQGDGSYAAAATVATLGHVVGLSVDGSGNVFVATSNAGTSDLWEYPSNGTAAVDLQPSLAATIAGLGLDQAGNIYYTAAGTLYQIPAGSSTATSVGTANLTGNIAFDAAGDAYGTYAGGLVEYPLQSAPPYYVTATGIALGVRSPALTYTSATVDAAGDVIAIDSSDYGVKLLASQSDYPGLAFPDTDAGLTATAMQGTLYNIGNAPLIFSAITPPSGGQFNSTGTLCAIGAPSELAPAAGCTFQAQFAPTASGAQTDSLVLASNGVQPIDQSGALTTSPATIALKGNGLATTLTVDAGTPQSAHVNAAFATPLQVQVLDSNSAAVVGLPITFTAPASGASGTFSNASNTITISTDSSGVAHEAFTANATPGVSYSVSASAPDATGVSFTLTNVGDATHFSVAPTTATPTAGAGLTATVNALDVNNQLDITFTASTTITSTDAQNTLPSPAALTAGAGTFALTLKTAGAQTITATAGSITGTAAVTVSPATAVSLAAVPPGLAQVGTAFTVAVTALDSFGNTVTSDGNALTVSGANATGSGQLIAGAGSAAVTLSAGGSQSFTLSDGTLSTTITLGAFPLTSPVATPVTAVPVTFSFTGSTAVASISVLTQGVTGKDFTLSATQPGNACAAQTYTAGQSCSVNVDFTTATPGLRAGAVVLADVNHQVLATTYVSGIGTGPALAFTGGAQTVIDSSDFTGPRSLAIDGNGNYYVADSTKSKIYMIPAGTVGGTGTDIGYTPAHTIQGIALDGAGNLYVAQNSGSTSTTTAELVRIPLENGVLNPTDKTTIGTYAPTAVATDAQGNVYIFDAATLNIDQINPAGAATLVANASGANGHFFDTLAIGPDGAIYFVAAGEEFSRYAPGTFSHSYITNFAGEGTLNGVAVDVAGDIFVTTSGAGSLMEMAPGTGTQTTLVSSASSIPAVALDPAGNAYFLGTGTGLNKLDLVDPPAFAFSTTQPLNFPSSALTTTVSNAGNADLVFGNFSFTTPQYDVVNACIDTTLAASAGSTCQVSVNFDPDSATSFSAAITLNDNAPVANSTQTIQLSGTGAKSTPTVSVSVGTPQYGDTTVATVSLTSSSRVPTGTVSWTLDGTPETDVTISNGQATLAVPASPALARGSHTIVVTYSGDADFLALAGDPSETTTVSVSGRGLRITLNGTITKPYDSTNTATLAQNNFTLTPESGRTTGVIAGDDVTVTYTATYSAAAVGSNYTVSVTGLGLTGTSASNYFLDTVNTSLPNMGSITAKSLTATLTGLVTKTYDGTNSATLAPANIALTGVVPAEAANVGATGSATYAQTSQGTGITVNATGLTLTGSAIGNYVLAATTASGPIGAINPATLTVTPLPQSLPYGTNFNTAATFTTPAAGAGNQYTLTGFVNSENITSAGISGYPALSTSAGPTTSVVTGGTITAAQGTLASNLGNYNFAVGAPALLTISPLTLTASLTGSLTKVYDGGTTFTGLSAANYVLTGVINSDPTALATLPTSGTYDSALVATSPNHVTVSGLALTNNAGGNYTLASTSVSGLATITAQTITATIIGTPTKSYDGTTAATLTAANYQLNGVIAADTSNVTLLSTPLSGTFNNATVAGASSISVTGLGIGGGASGNYSLNPTSASGPATITPATITPSLTGTVSKVYDATTTATLAPANFTFTNSNPNPDANIGITNPTSGSYDTKAVGSNKTVSVTVSLTGTNTANYQLSSGTAAAAVGTITQGTLTASLTGIITKVYDGGLTVALSGTNYSLSAHGGDDVSLATTPSLGVFASAGVGNTVNLASNGTVTISGADAGNYSLANGGVAAGIGSITAAPLTVTANNASIIVGGALPAFSATITGYVNGESATTANVTGAPSLTTTATGNTIGAFAITAAIGNLAAPNYSFSLVNGTLAVTPAPITAAATAVYQTSAAVAVTFPFSATTTVASAGVLSNGANDFLSRDLFDCIATFHNGDTCTVHVTFTPTAAGLRSGAVVLFDSSNKPLQTVYISGLGQGALGGFPNSATVAALGSGFVNPTSIAVDGAGDRFILDNGVGSPATVFEITPAGTQTTALALPFTANALALDGAGNLYLSVPTPGLILQVPLENGALNLNDGVSFSITNINGLAVDGSGNVYAASSSSGNISVITPAAFASGGTPSTLGSGLGNGGVVALDSAGNVYTTGTGNQGVVEIASNGTMTSIASPVQSIKALAVDAAGNIYFASAYGTNMVPAAANTTQIALINAIQGTFTSMVIDASGNLDVLNSATGSTGQVALGTAPASLADFGSQTIGTSTQAAYPNPVTVVNLGNQPLQFTTLSVATTNFALDASTTCATGAGGALAVGNSCTLVPDFTPTTGAGPLSDTLTLADTAYLNNNSGIGLSGTGVLIPQAISFAAPGAAAMGAALTLTATGGASGNPVSFSVTGGPGSLTGNTLTFTGAGTILVAANQAGNSIYAAAPEVDQSVSVAAVYPATAVASASAAMPVTFAFSSATTVASASVFSGGATDFASTDTANCVNSFTNGQTCTVDVTFTPTAAGLRPGAVVLYDGSGAPLQTIYISGLGQAALLTFPGGYYGHSFGEGAPVGASLAMDAAGDRYLLANGSLSITYANDPYFFPNSVLTGLSSNYTGMAFDGAGNLYLLDPQNSQISRIPNSAGTLMPSLITQAVTGVTQPTALALDAAGDLFYTTAAGTSVFEQSAAGASQSLGSNLLAGSPLGLDSNGNVYAVDQNNFITVITPAGVQTETPVSVTAATSIQVDAAGDIYVGASNGINEFPASSLATPIQVSTGNSRTMVLDSQANLFEVDVDNNYDFFYSGLTIPFYPNDPYDTYTYPLTSIGQSLAASHVLFNQGNLPLQFTGVSVATSNFAVDPANACTTSASVAPGNSCGLSFDFTPTTTGALTDTLTVASNNFANPAVTLALSGTGALISQTISFAPPSQLTYGAAPLTLNATGGTSGNPVTYTFVSGPATLSGATLTITGIGNIVVAADQAGDTTHAAAAEVDQTIAVVPAVITVTVNPETRVYGAANPAAAFTVTGLQYLDGTGVITGSPVLTYVATAATGVGTSAINVDVSGMSAANYTFTGVPGTLTITPAVLNIAAGNASSTYGAALPTLSGTVTGQQNGDTFTETFSTTATSASPVGAYPITPAVTGANLANYTVVAANGTLTVGPAVLNIAASSVSSTYGAALPTLSGTVTGQQNGDTFTETFSTTATSASPVGAYPITPAVTGANLANYTVVPANGTLTVGPAVLSIAASSLSSTYGAALPTLSGTVTGQQNGDAFSETFSTTATSASPVGAYPITPAVTGANLANYVVVPTAGTLTVTRAPLTITANNQTRVYGAANPAATYAVTGFVNGDGPTALAGTPALTYVATATTGVGTSAINVNAAALFAANYSITGVPGTLTITPAVLTVTANNASRAYQAADPAYSASLGGFLNGDAVSVVTGAAAFSTSATTSSAPGAYPITVAAGTLATPNYTFAFVPGTLTITPALQTITFAPLANQTYGVGTIALTATSSVGLPITFTATGPATVSVATLTITGAGAVTVTASQAGNANYTAATAVTESFTVAKASQTITFAAVPFTIPGSVVTLNATSTSGLPVTFQVDSGAAIVNGSQLTVTGAGNITVEADQTGSTNYLAAAPAVQTFSAGAPGVTLSAASLAFGSQTINTQSPAQTITVTNSGSSALHVATATAETPFAASTACATVAVGASCSISITFNPTATGAASGTLTITDDASSSPQTVSLAGAGTAPGVALLPSALTFGGQQVASTSAAQSLTVLNTGSAPLHVASVTATTVTGAPSTDFAASGTCATIAAGSSCSLNVTFTPTAVGARSGLITLTDDAGTQTVALAGTGTAAGVTLTPSNVVFPPVLVGAASYAQTVTLTNSGTAPLTSITLALAGDFSQTTTCAATLAAAASCSINLTYSPTLAGAETGALFITDSLGTQPIALAGTGLAPGVNLSTTQIVFGGQLVDSTSNAQTVVLTNSGTGTLTITSITPAAGFIEGTSCSATLAAGATCGINVSFAPTAAGSLTGAITVVDSAGTQTIAATGVGTTPGLALAPSNLSFGAQVVGVSSDAQTLTLSNTGTVALTLNPRAATGDYTEADACPATLAPSASCQISLVFTPSALGDRTGSISVSDASGLASTIAALDGTGTLPGISVAPGTVYFGSQSVGSVSAAQTVTITNSGSAPLVINAVAASAPFSQINTCTTAPLAPNGRCVISLTMTPATMGTLTGTLSIFDNADGIHSVALNGIGQGPGISLTPTALAFGSAPIPQPGSAITLTGTPQTVTLTNTGNAPLAVSSILVQGDFSQTNTCAASVAAGASCTINVNFSPTGLGHRTGLLAIVDNTASAIQTIALSGYGSPTGLTLSPSALNFGGGSVGVPSAPQVATLTNATGSAITSLAITASGEFTETDTCGTSLANGATCSLSIVLTPLTESGITGTISVAGTLANGSATRAALRSDATGSTSSSSLAVVALSGSGNPAAIQLSSSSLTFTPQAVGTASAAQSVTITNTGSTAALTTLTITSTPDFPDTTTCTATLAAGANCTVAVAFNPTAAGNRTGNLTISADGGLTAQVALSGTGQGGLLSVNPSTVAFGARPVGTTSAAQTITIANAGSAALSLQSITLAGGDFALGASTCGTLPQSLAANASCTLAVTFTASSPAAAAGSVTVTSNFGTAVVALSGSGNSQGLQLSATSLTFANQGVGLKSAAQTLTLTNQNSTAQTLTLAISGDFAQTSTCGTSLAAGASCALQVSFTPTAAGARSGTVTVTTPAGAQLVTLAGTGTNFTAGLASGASSSQTINAGGTATFNLLYTPGAFTGTVSLACSGAPANSTCSINPPSLNLTAGGTAATAVVTIATKSRAATFVPPAPAGPINWELLLALLSLCGLGLLAAAVKTGRLILAPRTWLLGALLIGAAATAACGGASNLPYNNNGTPGGTYTITITATAGTASQTTTLTLGVN